MGLVDLKHPNNRAGTIIYLFLRFGIIYRKPDIHILEITAAWWKHPTDGQTEITVLYYTDKGGGLIKFSIIWHSGQERSYSIPHD